MPGILRSDSPKATNFHADEDRLFVRSAARAMQVLGAFHRADGPLSLSHIAQRAGIDRSAAQRLVHTLVKLGYIRRSADDRGYLPGLRLLDHTLDVLRMDPVVQKATPVLLELRKTIPERVDLSLFDETRLIYALRIQSKRETFFATLVGHSIPTFCTAGGRAVLSALPDDAARDIILRTPLQPYTSKTRTEPDEIIDSISTARRNGYAMVTEEYVLGEVAIGVAITGRDGRPLGAIHVAASLAEWTPEEFVRQSAPVAIEAARAIVGSL
ncbi:IclR family transcriptional regulator [Pseudosulfitobacter sp. DSM 107133]|uniref:IclR family transcriptional regulator n=1 Tax=Pseudosulfitobacter sp. DSM 107133 TaxID=2883100 RepID=UPI000DF17432|nr:IclR family transcriptional regulator [Pseudosulfitobacter sp. DSM 107133]UOA28680.1 Pca regulon regulatory protein [Pseudosulfitobacter sp. DSM 107133]